MAQKSTNRKYDGAAPVARAARQTSCSSGGGGGTRRLSIKYYVYISKDNII